MILGEMIQAYARQEKVSIRRLAPVIGIKAPTLFRIMKGEATGTEQFSKLLLWSLSGSVPRKKSK